MVSTMAHRRDSKVLELDEYSTSRCGSGVEQLTRNEQVVGSIPTNGSISYVKQLVEMLKCKGPNVVTGGWAFTFLEEISPKINMRERTCYN
jgi:hypothetical protein